MAKTATRWRKGQSGNPKGGRPKSEVRIAFENAVKQVEKAKKKKFFLHVIERAWTDSGLMKEVLKKLVPDLKVVEANIDGGMIVRHYTSDEILKLLGAGKQIETDAIAE